MNAQSALARQIVNSVFSGLLAGIIYLLFALAITGGRVAVPDAVRGALPIGAISAAVAFAITRIVGAARRRQSAK